MSKSSQESSPITQCRITARIISDLEGSQVWQDPRGEHPDDISLMEKVKAATPRKDGSVAVSLNPAEVEALRLRAVYLIEKSKDGLSDYDPQYRMDALADTNAGRALERQLRQSLKELSNG